ncbi:MAG: hypothetical protein QXW06_00045 [Thermoplasmata archaeon]
MTRMSPEARLSLKADILKGDQPATVLARKYSTTPAHFRQLGHRLHKPASVIVNVTQPILVAEDRIARKNGCHTSSDVTSSEIDVGWELARYLDRLKGLEADLASGGHAPVQVLLALTEQIRRVLETQLKARSLGAGAKEQEDGPVFLGEPRLKKAFMQGYRQRDAELQDGEWIMERMGRILIGEEKPGECPWPGSILSEAQTPAAPETRSIPARIKPEASGQHPPQECPPGPPETPQEMQSVPGQADAPSERKTRPGPIPGPIKKEESQD